MRYGCHFSPLNMLSSFTLFHFLPQFNAAPQTPEFRDCLSSLLPTQRVSSFLSCIQTVNGFGTQGISFLSCGDHMCLESMLLLTPTVPLALSEALWNMHSLWQLRWQENKNPHALIPLSRGSINCIQCFWGKFGKIYLYLCVKNCTWVFCL